jgi:hypothetical protein
MNPGKNQMTRTDDYTFFAEISSVSLKIPNIRHLMTYWYIINNLSQKQLLVSEVFVIQDIAEWLLESMCWNKENR